MHMQPSRLDHCFSCHPSTSFPFPLQIFWRLIRPTKFQWENFTETTPHHISTNRQNAALLCSVLWVAPPLDSLGKNHSNEKLEELGKRVSNRKDLRGAQCKRSFVVLLSSSDSLWILTFQIKASFCAFNNLRQVLPCKRNICAHILTCVPVQQHHQGERKYRTPSPCTGHRRRTMTMAGGVEGRGWPKTCNIHNNAGPPNSTRQEQHIAWDSCIYNMPMHQIWHLQTYSNLRTLCQETVLYCNHICNTLALCHQFPWPNRIVWTFAARCGNENSWPPKLHTFETFETVSKSLRGQAAKPSLMAPQRQGRFFLAASWRFVLCKLLTGSQLHVIQWCMSVIFTPSNSFYITYWIIVRNAWGRVTLKKHKSAEIEWKIIGSKQWQVELRSLEILWASHCAYRSCCCAMQQ